MHLGEAAPAPGNQNREVLKVLKVESAHLHFVPFIKSQLFRVDASASSAVMPQSEYDLET